MNVICNYSFLIDFLFICTKIEPPSQKKKKMKLRNRKLNQSWLKAKR